jgi:hypothetical protein
MIMNDLKKIIAKYIEPILLDEPRIPDNLKTKENLPYLVKYFAEYILDDIIYYFEEQIDNWFKDYGCYDEEDEECKEVREILRDIITEEKTKENKNRGKKKKK